MLNRHWLPDGETQSKKATSDRQATSASGSVIQEKPSDYSNANDDAYTAKLAQVANDIRAGDLDRLSHSIARSRYQVGQTVTRRSQIDLMKMGLLHQFGRQYRVAA